VAIPLASLATIAPRNQRCLRLRAHPLLTVPPKQMLLLLLQSLLRLLPQQHAAHLFLLCVGGKQWPPAVGS
jgi:hypothetical protein